MRTLAFALPKILPTATRPTTDIRAHAELGMSTNVVSTPFWRNGNCYITGGQVMLHGWLLRESFASGGLIYYY